MLQRDSWTFSSYLLVRGYVYYLWTVLYTCNTGRHLYCDWFNIIALTAVWVPDSPSHATAGLYNNYHLPPVFILPIVLTTTYPPVDGQ